MNVAIQLTLNGDVTREVTGEISGRISQREEQLNALFGKAQRQALEVSLREDQPEGQRPLCCGHPTKKVRWRSRQMLTPVGWVQWERRVRLWPVWSGIRSTRRSAGGAAW